MDDIFNDARNGSRSSVQVDRIMFTSLCAAFSNLDPIVPPLVRRHSSRWRIFLTVLIGVMTFSASFAHLRYMMHHGTDRRVEQRDHTLRSLLFGGNPVPAPSQLRAASTKADVPSNPRLLLGATIASWTIWGILVATPFIAKRRNVAVGEGSEKAILTCVVFIIACILTYWTRIRYYGEKAAETAG